VTGAVSGQFDLHGFTVRPSATINAIWESQDAYIDTLAFQHAGRAFGTGDASAGVEISYALPIAHDWQLVPYIGGYFDEALDSPIGSGSVTATSAGRVEGGVNLTTGLGATINLGGQVGGIGTSTLTWSAKGGINSKF
jgi:hypothetical protein